MMCLLLQSAQAHTSLEGYVRESVLVSVGSKNIDISIQFVFPAVLSLPERKLMDRDGDGTLSQAERGAYLDNLQARAEERLRLSINGQRALLIPLRDPVLELQDAPGVEAHPHELRLSYFVRVPESFGVGGTVTLESGLWIDRPLMVSVSTEGADGIRFQTVDAQGLRQPSKDEALFRVTEARCTRWEPGDNKNGRI